MGGVLHVSMLGLRQNLDAHLFEPSAAAPKIQTGPQRRFDVLLQLGQSTLYALSDEELTSRNAVVVLLFLCKLNSTCLWLQVPECRFCLDNLLPLLPQRRRHRGVHPLPVGRRSEFHSDGQSSHRLPSRPCAFLFGLVVSTLNLNSKSYFACVAS